MPIQHCTVVLIRCVTDVAVHFESLLVVRQIQCDMETSLSYLNWFVHSILFDRFNKHNLQCLHFRRLRLRPDPAVPLQEPPDTSVWVLQGLQGAQGAGLGQARAPHQARAHRAVQRPTKARPFSAGLDKTAPATKRPVGPWSCSQAPPSGAARPWCLAVSLASGGLDRLKAHPARDPGAKAAPASPRQKRRGGAH